MFEQFIPLASVLTSLAAVITTWLVNRRYAREAKALEVAKAHALDVDEQFKIRSEIVRAKIELLAKKTAELSKEDGIDYEEMLLLLRAMDEIQADAKQSVRVHVDKQAAV